MAAPTPAQSLREYARGITGGLLFSLPVLYTMEVWWTGFIASPERLLAATGASLLLLLLYNRYAGLHADASWAEVAIDSVEEMGLGLLLAAGLLWLIGVIDAETSLIEIIGKVVVEGMVVAIGVSVGTAHLGADDGGQEASQGMRDKNDGQPSRAGMVALSLCGAFLVASNVAPTEEIVQIAAETPLVRIVGLAVVSILLSGIIVYFSNFRNGRTLDEPGWMPGVMQGIGITYAVALVTSAFLLWFFGRFANSTFLFACAQTVVLGLPAALGASAGRLLLQPAQP